MQDFYRTLLMENDWKKTRMEEFLCRSTLSKERIDRAMQQGVVSLACLDRLGSQL